MVSINRKLVVAGAAGLVLALLLWLIATIAVTVVPALPTTTPLAFFAVGFGGALAATLSEDITDNEKPKP